MQWGENEGQHIDCKIHGDMDYFDVGSFKVPTSPEIPSLDVLYDQSVAGNYFELIFSSVERHAKLIDKYHTNPKSAMYQTVLHDKIKFYDETAADPYFKVKKCYLLLIVGATEIKCGIEGLWKIWPPIGRKPHPNFGQ